MSTTEPQPNPPFLSDLCLLAVLGEMNLKSRLAASKVCPRWFHRVREVNQAVRSIAISVQARMRGGEEEEDDDDGGWRSELLDGHRGAIESDPSVRLLKKKAESDGSPLYHPLEPLTAADCLVFYELSDIITAQQIIAALPRVTELVFLGSSYGEEYQHLVEMLQSPVWRHQLTRLRLIDRSSSGCRQLRRLFAAINGLTSLRQLTLDLVSGDLSLLDLSALGRLETLHIDLQGLRTFLACLRKYAASGLRKRGGAALPRVELVNVGRGYLKKLGTLSLPLRRLIARLVEEAPMMEWPPRQSITSLLTAFPALSSLELGIPPWQVHQVFADLASLGGGGLFHLRLEVNFCVYSEKKGRRPFRPPSVAALSSVKALNLDLAITCHADLEWFNLPVTMPALEAIYLRDFYCRKCKRKRRQSSATDQCLRAVYEILQRTGLPPSQIAFNRDGKVCTMEELLNKDEPSS